MQQAQPLSREEIEEHRKAELKKIMELPRKEKRARLRIRQPWPTSAHGRVRSGIRTGTTPHFAAWMADLNVARVLHGIKLDTLADQLEGRLASTFAVLRVSGGYKNVLQLSKADVADLLRIPSIGIKSLEAVEDYLNSRRVRVHWTAK